MPTEDSDERGLPLAIIGPISTSELAKYFSQRSDLTYRRLEGLNVSDSDVYRSLFTGSLIRDCVFTRVIFTRSDLDGLRVERSIFIECNFTSCDIRSSIFTRCTFQSCNFNSTFIDDCEMQLCEFIECSFEGAILSRCRFQDTSLAACILTRGSILHNKFYNATISDMVLGDCTLLYIILRDCNLLRISIAAESVGAIFGLTKEQIFQANIIYLGNEEPVPQGVEVLSLISEEYQKRRWYIGQLVLAVNFQLTSTISAFDSYFLLTYDRFSELGFTKGDELEFLGDLIQELAVLNRLPFLTALSVLEWCTTLEDAFRQNNQDLPESSKDSLHTLAARITLLTNSLLDKLEQSLPEIEFKENDRFMYIRVAFDEKPSVPLTNLLNSISAASNLGVGQASYLVRTEKGSYIEIVCTTLFSILAFQIFLFLVNGCLIQLTELKQRLKVLMRKQAPKNYLEMALFPIQQTSPLMLSILQGLITYTKGIPWLKDSTLSGYVASNIKSLQVVEHENLTTPTDEK